MRSHCVVFIEMKLQQRQNPRNVVRDTRVDSWPLKSTVISPVDDANDDS